MEKPYEVKQWHREPFSLSVGLEKMKYEANLKYGTSTGSQAALRETPVTFLGHTLCMFEWFLTLICDVK